MSADLAELPVKSDLQGSIEIGCDVGSGREKWGWTWFKTRKAVAEMMRSVHFSRALMCQWKKNKNNLIWIKIKILVVVWVVKEGVGSLSNRFEEWVGWDSPAAPVLENREWTGKSWGHQWLYSCLKWKCSKQRTWFPRRSAAMGASLGWLSFHWLPFWLEHK